MRLRTFAAFTFMWMVLPGLTSVGKVEPSKSFAHIVFEDSFPVDTKAGSPAGWTVLKSQMHEQCRVEDGAYRILFGMNTHCPTPVELRDFAIEFDVRGYRDTPVACLFFDFRIHPDRRADRAGYRILYRWGKPDYFKERFAGNPKLEPLVEELVPKTVRLDLIDLRHRGNIDPILSGHRMEFGSPGSFDPTIVRADPSTMVDKPDIGTWSRIRIEVEGNRMRLFHDGHFQGELSDPQNLFSEAGMLGFDAWGSSRGWEGGLWIDNVTVYAREPLPEKTLVTLKNIHIPEKYNRLHGRKMLYDVNVSRVGRAWRLWAKVRGGGCQAGISHILENPYVRIETKDGRHHFRMPLFRGTLGAGLGRRGPQSAPYGPADRNGPVEAAAYFDFDPQDLRVAVGYDYYTIPPRYQDGPCEVMVDAGTGGVLCEGMPMRNGSKLTMASPPEKNSILDRVDEGNRFRDGFKAFLKDNHFFVTDEEIRFRADLLLAQSGPGRSYLCRYHVLDAYKDPLDVTGHWTLKADGGELADQQRGAGLHPFTSGWRTIAALPVGVYHLRLEARDDRGATLAELTKAFSVLPAEVDLDRTPAERSGLPTFFGGSPYPFHAAYQVDTYHYASCSVEWAHRPDAAEIKHALNQRVKLSKVDLTTPEGIAVAKKYRDWYHILSHPKLPAELKYLNSPRIYNKASRCVKEFVTGFLDSEFFRPDPKHPLNVTGDQVEALDRPAYTELHDTIKAHYWKGFTNYVSDFKAAKVKEARAFMRETLGDDRAPVSNYAYPLPVNQDYMTPYDAMNSAGINLKRDGWFRDFAVVEAYWPECHYPSDRDWACWAMMKMVAPQTYYLWDLEGDVNAFGDGNCALGWPPWGAMNVAPGFFKKAMVSYVYGPMHVEDGNVVWSWDGGMRLGYLQPERIREVLDGYRIRHRHEPAEPVKTVAYLYAQDWIAKHPERLDPAGYPHNTAAECIVFAYEEGNRAGVLNGFFCQPEDLSHLTPSQINTLVLPPLTHAPQAVIDRIRNLHRQGVNLVCFEDPGALAPLFGVKPLAEGVEVEELRIADNANSRQILAGVSETRIQHAGLVRNFRFALTQGTAILECLGADGDPIGPGLVVNDGATAKTLLWTLPPTDISRSLNHQSMRLRGESDSELIRFSMGRGLKAVADTPVTTTEGHLLSFRDTQGRLVIIVYENEYPFPSKSLHPLVQINMPGVGAKRLVSAWPHEEGVRTKDALSFHFDLNEHDVAVFTLE